MIRVVPPLLHFVGIIDEVVFQRSEEYKLAIPLQKDKLRHVPIDTADTTNTRNSC